MKTMKVIFATTNESKIKKFKSKLEENSIELLTLKDLEIKKEINENGKDAIENAMIKAKAYYDDNLNIPVIGMDNCLFIEGVSKQDQPGTHVRRINEKELDDEEMLIYYTDLVEKYKKKYAEKNSNINKLTAKWIYGISIYDGKEFKNFSWSKENFYLVDKIHKKRNKGYPLDSISIDEKLNKYFVEFNEKDKNQKELKSNDDKIINFIVNAINNNKNEVN